MLLVLHFSCHELGSKFGNLFVLLLFVQLFLCLKPYFGSAKTFSELVLKSKRWKDDVGTLVDAVYELLKVNLITSSEVVLLNSQTRINGKKLNKGFFINVASTKLTAKFKHIDLGNYLVVVFVEHAEDEGDHLRPRKHIKSTE